jgi:hypothetical protein
MSWIRVISPRHYSLTMEFASAPAPWPETAPEPQPELRAELEELGFRMLGAQAVTMDPADVAELVDDYAVEHHETFLQWALVPAQIFAAPDGSAFARLSWFWSGRQAELSTVLPDGQLVTTVTAWGVDPPWPRTIERAYARTTDRHLEQALHFSDAASLRIIDGDAAELWSTHRAFVASIVPEAGRLPGHTVLEDAVRLYQHSQEVRERLARRAVIASWLVWVVCVLAVVGAYAVLQATVLPPAVLDAVLHPAVVVGIVVAAFVLGRVAVRSIALRARHWWWLRPSVAAPVPGSPWSHAEPDW